MPFAQSIVENPAELAGDLANIPGTPTDRLIVASAVEKHQLVTSDARILKWSGALHRLDAKE